MGTCCSLAKKEWRYSQETSEFTNGDSVPLLHVFIANKNKKSMQYRQSFLAKVPSVTGRYVSNLVVVSCYCSCVVRDSGVDFICMSGYNLKECAGYSYEDANIKV